jgi:hypothetical protein
MRRTGSVWQNKGLRFPLGAGCVITTEPYGRRAAFRELREPEGKRRGAAGEGAVGVLPVVLGAARTAQV